MNQEPTLHADNKTVFQPLSNAANNGTLTQHGTAQHNANAQKQDGHVVAKPAVRVWDLQPKNGYCRNSLLAAATPLLSRVARNESGKQRIDCTALFKELTALLKEFEQNASLAGCEPGDSTVAHYLLCTFADETVMNAYTGDSGPWNSSSLLGVFHGETDGGVRFFEHLARAERTPANHLDMLELMYMCLSLGFQGKYRLLARGAVEVENIRESLYRQTRSLRGEHTRELSPHWQGLDHRARRTRGNVPGWIVGLFTLVSLAAIYGGFAWVLAEQRHSALEPFLQLDQPAIESRR